MKQVRLSLVRGRHSLALIAATLMLLGSVCGHAQKTPAVVEQTAGTVPAIMLSDIHFDPFQDPAKFERLRTSPATAWQKIFSEPDSPTQVADLGRLMQACKQRGSDSSWALMESSLKAARTASPHALFVTVSGDLLVHSFDCRFRNLAPHAAEGEYSEFAAKTIAYVVDELHKAFPVTPVYLALGNNDSGCGDYHETKGSKFLQGAAESFGSSLENSFDKGSLLKVFSSNGSYSVALPKPIVRGRLIVLQDIFLAATFTGCNGKPDPKAADEQLAWLRAELTAAHERNEQVWVMAHIPPGIDVYNTFAKKRDVCGGESPVMFLGNEKLVDVLTDFAADIRLAIFAHTHMDEMRLLQGSATQAGPAIAAKLVPSVSPINGNYPAFTVAEVDPKTATLKDYRVLQSDSKTGVGAKWTEEYRFSTTYKLSAFTPDELVPLLAGFAADKDSSKPLTWAYEQNFMVNGGLRSLAIRLVWPQYVCAMQQNTAAGFRDCMCPGKP